MAFFLNTKTKEVSEFDPAINKQLLNEFQVPIPEATTLAQAQLYAGQAGGYPAARAITSGDITNQSDIQLPQPKDDTTNYQTAVARGQSLIAGGSATGKQDLNEIAQLVAELTPKPESQEKAFFETYGKTKEQVLQEQQASQAAFNAKRSQLRMAEAEMQGIQAEIQTVIDKAKADALRLEEQAKGQLVTTTALTRSQTEIHRQAAIAALPLQSKALAQQAKIAGLQGDLTTAQETLKLAQGQLDRAFELKLKDIENEHEYRRTLLSAIVPFLTKAEERVYKEAKDADTRKETERTAELKSARDWAEKMFDAGDSALAGEFGDLLAEVPSLDSPTYAEDIKAFRKDVADLVKKGKAKEKPVTGQSDFEQAFLRDKGRLPTVAELLDYKTKEAAAGRKGETGGLVPSAGFFDPKIESSIREDFVALTGRYKNPIAPTEDEKAQTFKTLRNLYSPQEANDDALRTLIGITPPSEIPPADQTTQQAASSWLGGLFKGGFIAGVKRIFGESEERIRFDELDGRFIRGETLTETEMEEYRTALKKFKK